mgnify:CR=1 FL=1
MMPPLSVVAGSGGFFAACRSDFVIVASCPVTESQKNTTLFALGSLDLACFALGGMHYGDVWSGMGVFGLLLFLALFELL